ncbi:MAG: putative pyridoxal-dependent aspartate 1-decarboxylase [Desulfobacteraceae bacterium]|nr:putative pyridoxal-dependent aspartate 1-decarboxylase [Desulfobacteraceae bacterium]
MEASTPPAKKKLIADWKTLNRIFIRPEDDDNRRALFKHMEQILFGLHDFLQKHVGITEEASLKELADRFTDTLIQPHPEKRLSEVISDLVHQIAPHAVNVASPYFIGHMTSAIPYFMVHLKTITAALNQNVNKAETSKVLSIIEKQVLAKIHRLIFKMPTAFYDEHVQNPATALGCFTEGGTLANITALWVARNSLLAPKGDFNGCEQDGVVAGLQAHGIERCVILVSRLGHFSLRKAAGLLGIGNRNVLSIDVDAGNRIKLSALKQCLRDIQATQGRTRVIAIVGIAGATETGSIDPLPQLAEICAEHGIYYHVDAAWGGPTLLSEKYGHLLEGIHLADSVTVDGHKQLYMPMGCGMVYFKNPHILERIAYHARYIARQGSVDLGIRTLSGSREANSLVLASALQIMGSRGYSLLIEHGIATAKSFAAQIKKRPLFQLVTEPRLNILTYRVCPPEIKAELESADTLQRRRLNAYLNDMNRGIQVLQREGGVSFVSRTTLYEKNSLEDPIVVLRSVIMNPLTTLKILNEILDEQEKIYRDNYL